MQWVCFGGEGVITENVRDEQRKFIKCNHLVANLLSFHTLVTMTKALQRCSGKAIHLASASVRSPRSPHLKITTEVRYSARTAARPVPKYSFTPTPISPSPETSAPLD